MYTRQASCQALPSVGSWASARSNTDRTRSGVTVSSAGGQLTVSVQSNHGADDVTLALEISSDLAIWVDAPAESFTTTATNNGDGTSTLTFQSTAGFFSSTSRRFVRVRARATGIEKSLAKMGAKWDKILANQGK